MTKKYNSYAMPHISFKINIKIYGYGKMCPLHALIQCQCLFWCCSNCPRLVIPGIESTSSTRNTYPKINFNSYTLLSWYTVNVRWLFELQKNVYSFQYLPQQQQHGKKYTHKNNLF